MRRFSHFSAVVALPLLLSASSLVVAQAPAPAPQDVTVDPGARSAFESGRDAYDRGRFGEALQHFSRAYALAPSPVLLYNIGRAAESDLQNERAIQAYESYLSAVPTAENREFVQARLTKLREITQQGAAPAPTVQPVAPAPAPYVAPPPSVTLERPVDRSIPGFRLYGGFRLGVGGKYALDYDDDAEDETTGDLKPTPGIQLGLGYAWRIFGIGVEFRTQWLKADGGEREAVYDIVLKPRVGYVLRSVPLEFYGALPLGVSVPTTSGLSVGPTLGLLFGMSYFFSQHVGINAELGWQMHGYAFDDGYDYVGGVIAFSEWSPLTVNLMFAF